MIFSYTACDLKKLVMVQKYKLFFLIFLIISWFFKFYGLPMHNNNSEDLSDAPGFLVSFYSEAIFLVFTMSLYSVEYVFLHDCICHDATWHNHPVKLCPVTPNSLYLHFLPTSWDLTLNIHQFLILTFKTGYGGNRLINKHLKRLIYNYRLWNLFEVINASLMIDKHR